MIWPLVLRRVGYRLSWLLAAGLMIIGGAFVALAGTPNWAFQTGLVLTGIGYAGVQVVGFVALADAANRSEATGLSGSGILTGLWLAGEKVAAALGPLLAGLTMQFAVLPGGSTRTALIIAIGLLPAALAVAAMVVLARDGEQITSR